MYYQQATVIKICIINNAPVKDMYYQQATATKINIINKPPLQRYVLSTVPLL